MKAGIPQIDALRGLAALTVAFVYHQHYLHGWPESGPLASWPVFAGLHTNGWVMVDLFFVISGFVFAHVYLTEGRMNCDPGRFARARFARLYPLHLATLLAAALVFAGGEHASVTYVINDTRHFVLNLLMLQESGLNAGKSFNSPSWSISIEVMCYLLFYVVASRFSKWLIRISIGLAVAGLLLTLQADTVLDHVGRGLCGFFAGVLAHHWRTKALPVLAVACLGGIALLALRTGLSAGAVLGLLVFPPLVILAPGIAALRHPALTWLGERSYSLYLIHGPFYMAINVYLFEGQRVGEGLLWPTVIAAWLGLLAVADASYRYLEMPARRWLNSARAGRRFATT